MVVSKFILFMFLLLAVIGLLIWIGKVLLAKRARALGYESVQQYLYAVPSSDAQKYDATDLALKGVVMTCLGVLFAPLMFVGLLPLYYGFRKVILLYMGVGLFDAEP